MASNITVPPTYKAVVYDKPGEISTKVVELKTPSPGTGEVLVNLTHSGVCHSDLGVMTNSWKLPFLVPDTQVGGHEGIGKVVQIGLGAESCGFQIGDRVGVKWIRDVCGTCGMCLEGRDGLCPKQTASGFFHPGTFQQYVTAPARYLTRIPTGLESAAGAPMLCAGLTTYAALRKTNTRGGNWLVVSGAGGGLGHIAVQLASRAFGLRVIGIDEASKEKIVTDSGAEVFLDLTQVKGEDLTQKVMDLTQGLGAHAALICAASNAAYAQGVGLLRPGGTLVGVGMPGGDRVPISSLSPGLLVQRELKVVGSILGNRQDANDVLDLAARGIVSLHYEVKSMSELTETFQQMQKGTLKGRVVLDLEG